MSRLSPGLSAGAALALVFVGCSTGPEPTQAELDDIDAAAERAADRITEENADAEFEKLKKEMGPK